MNYLLTMIDKVTYIYYYTTLFVKTTNGEIFHAENRYKTQRANCQ